MEAIFHADWSKNGRDRGLCTYCVYHNIVFFFSGYLDFSWYTTGCNFCFYRKFERKKTVDYFLTQSLVTDNLKARETSAFKNKHDSLKEICRDWNC